MGLSVLKRVCRQKGLARWPYRTRQSLRGVIARTEEFYQARLLPAQPALAATLHPALAVLSSESKGCFTAAGSLSAGTLTGKVLVLQGLLCPSLWHLPLVPLFVCLLHTNGNMRSTLIESK